MENTKESDLTILGAYGDSICPFITFNEPILLMIFIEDQSQDINETYNNKWTNLSNRFE